MSLSDILFEIREFAPSRFNKTAIFRTRVASNQKIATRPDGFAISMRGYEFGASHRYLPVRNSPVFYRQVKFG